MFLLSKVLTQTLVSLVIFLLLEAGLLTRPYGKKEGQRGMLNTSNTSDIISPVPTVISDQRDVQRE